TNINFSGHLITEAIEQGLKIDHDDAEKLKITNGLRYDKEHPKYLKIVADLVDKLVDEIKLSLNFYKEHFKNTNPITHITMCGGASALSNMDNILSNNLKIASHPGNVWKNIKIFKLNEENKARGLSMASAIGLALRAAENPLKE
ncbi:MAG: pilus assembly protein PilM, partial [Patescibacteria group bacterium]